MRLLAVISDYIRRSILTTQGDLVVRGATEPQRLAAGALNTLLKGQGAGEIPAFEQARLDDCRFASGSFTILDADPKQIRGLGFKPSLVIFFSGEQIFGNMNWSIGIDDASIHVGLGVTHTLPAQFPTLSYSIYVMRTGLIWVTGWLTAMDADGFDVHVNVMGGLTVYCVYFAIE